mmetsp:Transcript_141911/g.441214  ORF Transcript_141911/g.441214 Transcript_141911/m.441214 type:complete len:336 (+) Transcript_141911:820-1827(+)
MQAGGPLREPIPAARLHACHGPEARRRVHGGRHGEHLPVLYHLHGRPVAERHGAGGRDRHRRADLPGHGARVRRRAPLQPRPPEDEALAAVAGRGLEGGGGTHDAGRLGLLLRRLVACAHCRKSPERQPDDLRRELEFQLRDERLGNDPRGRPGELQQGRRIQHRGPQAEGGARGHGERAAAGVAVCAGLRFPRPQPAHREAGHSEQAPRHSGGHLQSAQRELLRRARGKVVALGPTRRHRQSGGRLPPLSGPLPRQVTACPQMRGRAEPLRHAPEHPVPHRHASEGAVSCDLRLQLAAVGDLLGGQGVWLPWGLPRGNRQKGALGDAVHRRQPA